MAKETTKRGPGRPKGSKNKKSKEENIPKVPKSKEEQIKEMQLKNRNDSRVNDAIWAVAIFALGVFFFFTIITDTTGAFGAYIHDVCMGLFGVIAYVMPFYFIVYAVLLMLKKMQHINIRTVVFSVVLFLDLCILNSYRFIDPAKLQFGFGDIANYYTKGVAGEMGGAVGMELGSLIIKGFGASGLLIFGIALLLICLLLIVNTPISEGIEKFREKREAKRLLRQMEEAEARSIIDRVQEAPVITQAAAAPALQYSEPVVSKPVIEVSPSPAAQASAPSNEPEYTPFEVINNKPTVLPTESFDREDDYEKNVAKISYGLDGDVPLRTGYGLDGYGSDNFVSGSGTKGLVPEAVKRDDYVPSNEPSYKRPSEPVVKTYTDTPAPAPAPEALETKEEVKVRKPVKRATKKEIEEDMNEDDLTLEKDLESAVSGGNEVKMYTLPSANLLKTPKRSTSALSESQLQNKAMLLEETLRNFGVSATVLKVTQGASVTRYEVQPATGVKVNKITSLADDIALNMRAKSIRMEAPIPGKAAVGIEIENDKAAPVLIKELIDSEEFRNSSSKISFVVGKDISGNNIVADLKGMPHMLIAGATGSGKSVCINTIITSILYKANPYEVKFIMIDPKVVELGNYNGIPHMSIPVVTDPKKAARALNWAVGEMNKRYEEFANVRVKDLESYNDYARANHMEVKPQIVIIIDELADLMMAAPSQVEESICRLAQKARAAGMHLIVATQRPSVDIVTGVIKANIPSRIAFSVSSQFDSRTILDMAGAEKLLGKGDMLFYPVGANKPLRVQGPYISDAETQAVIDYAKKQADPDYNEELSSDINSEAEPGKGGSGNSNAAPDKDELTDDAIEFIIKSKQASVSMLQRRFRIGYNRAARIIDEIEAMGIIGPSDGSRPRQVLMTEEEYYGMDEQLTVDEIEDTDADEYEE